MLRDGQLEDKSGEHDDYGAKAAAQRNGKFSGPIRITIGELIVDPRFRDIRWSLFTDGVLPQHVQVNFLRMLHVFFMEGVGEHVGQFLEENEVTGKKLAKMISTVDEDKCCSDCSFLCNKLGEYLCYDCCCTWCPSWSWCGKRRALQEKQRAEFEKQAHEQYSDV